MLADKIPYMHQFVRLTPVVMPSDLPTNIIFFSRNIPGNFTGGRDPRHLHIVFGKHPCGDFESLSTPLGVPQCAVRVVSAAWRLLFICPQCARGGGCVALTLQAEPGATISTVRTCQRLRVQLFVHELVGENDSSSTTSTYSRVYCFFGVPLDFLGTRAGGGRYYAIIPILFITSNHKEEYFGRA